MIINGHIFDGTYSIFLFRIRWILVKQYWKTIWRHQYGLEFLVFREMEDESLRLLLFFVVWTLWSSSIKMEFMKVLYTYMILCKTALFNNKKSSVLQIFGPVLEYCLIVYRTFIPVLIAYWLGISRAGLERVIFKYIIDILYVLYLMYYTSRIILFIRIYLFII